MAHEFINLIRRLPAPDLDYWQKNLRVNAKYIQSTLKSENNDEIDALLVKLFKNRESFWKIIGESLEIVGTKLQTKEAIIKDHVNSNIILVMLLCQELLSGKNGNAKKRVIEEILKDKVEILGSLKGLPLAQCILLYSLDQSKLIYYILFNSTEKAALKQFNLSVKRSVESEDEFEKIQSKLQKRIDFAKALNDMNIDSILTEFEKKAESNKTSKMLNILSNRYGLTLYLQRSWKDTNISEQADTIFGKDTNIIIMNFSEDGKLLKQHSIQKDAINIASLIASKAYNTRLEYLEDKTLNKNSKFELFLNKIIKNNKNDLIFLKEIKYQNFELQDSPILWLVSREEVSLSESIKDFKEKGFDLFSNLSNILYIKLSFKSNEHDTANLITLNVIANKQVVILKYLNNHLSSYKTAYFQLYMKDEHDLLVTPESSTQTSNE